LQITDKASSYNKQTDIEISGTPAPANGNIQTMMPKSIVPDPGWFDSDWTKFEDWWRDIRLFLKSNRVTEIDDRITAIIACLRESVVGIYAQRKLDELDEELKTQDWEDFVKEIKTTFSNKMITVDAKWKIKTFKQGKKNTVDFIIEFKALAMKADNFSFISYLGTRVRV